MAPKGEKGTNVWACRALCSQSKINTTNTAQHASVTVHQLFTGIFCSKFLFTRLLEDELERMVFVCMSSIGHLRLQTQIEVTACSILLSRASSISIRLALQVQDVYLSTFSISYLTDSQGQEKAVPLSCFPHLSLFCFLEVPTALEIRGKHFKNYSYYPNSLSAVSA